MAEEYKQIISEKLVLAERLMNDDQINKCRWAIHTASVACATAGAVPIPVVDALPITTAQIAMVMRLGNIFHANVTESIAKGLIGAAAATFVGRSLVKLIPIFGWGVSAAVAAGVTEAIGWTIAVDFAKDAKARWEKEHKTDENSYQHGDSKAEFDDSSDEEEKTDNPENYLDDLAKRADEFISGEKNRSEHEKDYSKLRSDIEGIIDSLPFDHPLRKKYDDLSLIMD